MEDFICPNCQSVNTYFSKKRQVGICEDCDHSFAVLEQNSKPHTTKKLQLFFSYGHDSNEELILKLKDELENRGHSVWIDKKEIKSGYNWRQSIADGISKSESVLAFLSKHSVRDPGVCRDELRIALYKDAIIKTVLLENENEVSVPASVASVQWLDMQDWKQYLNTGEWNDWFKLKLGELFRVIESEENIAFAGELEEIKKVFNPPTSNSKEKRLNEQDFSGREWISEKIEAWRKFDANSKLLALFGGPGTGKSRFVAHELHYNPNVLCSVFCEWDKQEFNNAKSIVVQLIFKLSCKLSDFRKKLLDKIKERDHSNSPLDINDLSAISLMDEFLIHPLSNTIDGGREIQYIVIDGLDEADENGENVLIDVITRCMDKLPPWIIFIVTSRPEKSILQILDNYNPRIINIESDENDDDIIKYLKKSIPDELVSYGKEDVLVHRILKKSEGSFLYINLFIQGVKEGSISLSDEKTFPAGLGGFYMKNFKRKFNNQDDYLDVRNYFELLVASQNLPVQLLLRLLNKDRYEFKHFEEVSGSLVKTSEQKFTYLKKKLTIINFHHKSLADWLISNKSGKFFVDMTEGGMKLSNFARSLIGNDKPLSMIESDPIKAFCKHNITDYFCISESWSELTSFLNEKSTDLIPYWFAIENVPEHADKLLISGLRERIKAGLDRLLYKDEISYFVEMLKFFEEITQFRYLEKLFDELCKRNLDVYLQERRISSSQTSSGMFDPNKISIAYSISTILSNCRKNGTEIKVYVRNKLENIKLSCLYQNTRVCGKNPEDLNIRDIYPLYMDYQYLLNANNCHISFKDTNNQEVLKNRKLCDLFNALCFIFEINNGVNYVNINVLRTLGVDVNSTIKLALKFREKLIDKSDNQERTFVYSNIAKMFSSIGYYKESLDWHQKVLQIRLKHLGQDHLDTVETYENIAYAHNELGNYNEAFNWYDKALKLLKNKYGEEHPRIGSIYHNIGKLVGDQGREDLSIDWDLKALKIREKFFGKDHPETANTYHNLGYSYEYLGAYDKALEMDLLALAIKKKTLRNDHPHIAKTYACLASVNEKKGNYSESLKLYLKALDIRVRSLGEEHPFTARTYTSLGDIYRLCGNNEEALKYLNLALNIRVGVFGEEHAETAVVHHRIGKVYFEQGKYSEAREKFKLALHIREKVMASDNTDIAKSQSELALVSFIQGEKNLANQLFESAIRIQKNLFGEDHIFVAQIYDKMASANYYHKNYPQALELWNKALDIYFNRFGEGHIQTARIVKMMEECKFGMS